MNETAVLLAKTKTEAVKQSSPLIEQASSITITDETSYMAADNLRTSLKGAFRKWSDRLELVIRPARQSLDSLYALNREICSPLEGATNVITAKMKEYKRAEAERIMAEEVRRREQQQRVQALAHEVKKALSEPSDSAARSIAKIAREKWLAQAADTALKPAVITAPVQAENSTARSVDTWKITDLAAVVKGISEGLVPVDVLTPNSVVINAYFRQQKDDVKTWPGFEVYQDFQISQKRKA